MKIYNFIFLLIIFSLFISCTNEKKYENLNTVNRLNLLFIDSLSFEYGDDLMGFVNMIKKSSSGKYLFNDIMQQKIFIFDENRTLYSIIGGSGSGPTEFNQILSFTTQGDTVIAYDQSLDKFKLFRESGTYIKSIEGITAHKILSPSFELYSTKNSILIPIIQTGFSRQPWNSNLFANISLDGELITTFGSYSPLLKEANYFDYTPITAYDTFNNKFFVTYTSAYIIDVLDASGQIINSIQIDSKNLKKPEKRMLATTNRAETLKQLRAISTPRNLFITKDFLLYYFTNTNEGKDDLYLIVFDKENLNHLSEIKIEFPPRYTEDHNNRVLFESHRKNGSLNYTEYEINIK